MKKIFLFTVCVGAVVIWAFSYFNKKKSLSDGLLSRYQDQKKNSQVDNPGMNKSANQFSSRNPSRSSFTNEELESSDKFFDEFTKSEATRRLYENSLKIFGKSSHGEAAARWVALGVSFDSSQEYGISLQSSLAKANQNPEGVLERIKESIHTVRKDPFIYQMTMNLVFQLDLNREDQGEFYAKELEDQITALTNENPSDQFWISTLGLALAKQSGAQVKDMEPFLRRAMKITKANPQILLDFKKSAEYYFPGLSL